MPSQSPIHLLTQRVDILRPTTQTNDFGLPHLVWQLFKEQVPAKVELLGGDSGAVSRDRPRHKIYLPLETDIRQLDRILINDRQFQVLVVTSSDTTSHVVTALTTEVQP
ncbi:MAG TPA: hypothetical protein DCM28_11010 [Phycisphaerales bacterium]|nr:hypothetical protein [Phycisphaerales bacterium]HCD32342.1 hypothetical protein [Phycisphaerales bacterium]|tara:strand:+ start:341 stop:667 length:327 start_codon:yes stop_codon:yes gene_type:complete